MTFCRNLLHLSVLACAGLVLSACSTVNSNKPAPAPKNAVAGEAVAPVTKHANYQSENPAFNISGTVEAHDSYEMFVDDESTKKIITELETLIGVGKNDGIERRVSYDPKTNTILVVAPADEKAKALEYLNAAAKAHGKVAVLEGCQLVAPTAKPAVPAPDSHAEEPKPALGTVNDFIGFSAEQDPRKNPTGRGTRFNRHSVQFIYGLPSKHYQILGKLILKGYRSESFTMKQAAGIARSHGGNAVILTSPEELAGSVVRGDRPKTNKVGQPEIYAWVINAEI